MPARWIRPPIFFPINFQYFQITWLYFQINFPRTVLIDRLTEPRARVDCAGYLRFKSALALGGLAWLYTPAYLRLVQPVTQLTSLQLELRG